MHTLLRKGKDILHTHTHPSIRKGESILHAHTRSFHQLQGGGTRPGPPPPKGTAEAARRGAPGPGSSKPRVQGRAGSGLTALSLTRAQAQLIRAFSSSKLCVWKPPRGRPPARWQSSQKRRGFSYEQRCLGRGEKAPASCFRLQRCRRLTRVKSLPGHRVRVPPFPEQRV